jgi:glycosyltransferase involved in cell wall biosynthesis
VKTVALIPAHNEALTVRGVVDATLPLVDEVIVIDDGSTDETYALLVGSGAQVIRHESNNGKGARLVEGLSLAYSAGAAQVITLDADQQHDPADIPAFREAASAHPGALILGDRSGAMATMPKHRSRAIKFGNFFIGWACGRRIKDAQCGMRLYPAAIAEVCVPSGHITGFRFETAILMYAAEADIPFAFVPIKARYEGYVMRPSHFHPVRDFLRLVSLITGFLATRGFRPRGLLIALGLVR